jgi:hypothetical protein
MGIFMYPSRGCIWEMENVIEIGMKAKTQTDDFAMDPVARWQM